MTQLVVDAERRGELPPKGISPTDLEGPEQPTLAELKASFNLYRLSRALAEAFCQRDVQYPSGEYYLPGAMSNDTPLNTHNIALDMSGKKHRMPPEPPNRVSEWIARVSQAVFRVLIVGAALAGTYWEPILAAYVHPDPEVRLLTTEGAELEAKAWDFLLSFAAYDLEAPLEAQDALFAPLVEWLLANILGDQQGREAMAARFDKGVGRAKLCLDRGEDENWPCPLATVIGIDGSSHADAHLVVWELMKMFWVVEQLRPWNSPEPPPVSREDLSWLKSVVDPRQSASPPSSSSTHSEPPPPLALAVLFGQWRAEKVALPTCPGFTGDWYTLHAYPAVSDPVKDACPDACPVQWLLDTAFYDSERPNHFEWTDPVPPLELKFFEYFFRRKLNLCFSTDAFRTGRGDLLSLQCQEFVECITIFCHDDVEGRRSGAMTDGDFIDGSELLSQWPPQGERFHQFETPMI